MYFPRTLFATVSAFAAMTVMSRGCGANALNTKSAQRGSVEFCTSNDYDGTCYVDYPDNDKCYNLPDYMNDEASSAQVKGGESCYVFENRDCTGKKLYVSHDQPKLSDDDFNDGISSYKCSDE